ncbi:MAG: F0F1 ATP synthase subunit delta [Chloroflexota bacterium]
MARVAGRARRYAEAAFDVGLDSGGLDDWEEQLAAITAILAEPSLHRAFTSPVVSRERKEEMILGAFPEMEPQVRNFLVLLVRQDRLNLLPDILTTFRALLNEHRGIQVVEVTTAEPLDQATGDLVVARLAQHLGRQVVIETRVDPDIIGGLVARIGDKVLDGSIRGRLDRLRVALAQTV